MLTSFLMSLTQEQFVYLIKLHSVPVLVSGVLMIYLIYKSSSNEYKKPITFFVSISWITIFSLFFLISKVNNEATKIVNYPEISIDSFEVSIYKKSTVVITEGFPNSQIKERISYKSKSFMMECGDLILKTCFEKNRELLVKTAEDFMNQPEIVSK